jgi:hypothetical protein
LKGMYLIKNRLSVDQASLRPLSRHGVLCGKEKKQGTTGKFYHKKRGQRPFP